MSRLGHRLWCLATGHDASWVHGISLGIEHPVCRRCGADRPVVAMSRGAAGR